MKYLIDLESAKTHHTLSRISYVCSMGNFRFPVKFKLPRTYINNWVLRDHFKRLQSAEHEVTTRALKFIARNTQLPPKARLEAQLQLTTMPNYTRMTQVKDRCVASGTAKSVIKEFRLNRVSFFFKKISI